MRLKLFLAAALVAGLTLPGLAADDTEGLKKGTPEIKSITALAFGPNGTLFVGDPAGAKIYAIATGDTKPAGKDDVKLENVGEKIASMIGVPKGQAKIEDMKVNPASGNIYLAVTRGQGAQAAPIVLKLNREGQLSEFALKDVAFASVDLPSANVRNRTEAITSLGFIDGKVVVAGLSNEEFASTLRSFPYPFTGEGSVAGVQIFHGAHGKFETNAPIRTFTSYKVDDQENVVAAYTCTPLVKIPVNELKPGAKVSGTTIAELGNRNRPLDMIVYSKDGKDFILMANSARGVMKIPAEQFAKASPITEKPKTPTAGVGYETIEALKGIVQLDKLDDARALVLVQTEAGALNLTSIPLP